MKRTIVSAFVLLTATASGASHRSVPVPFVGCPSGGQLGLQPAPRKREAHSADGKVAAKLAYYSDGELGVLGPRGWHCSTVSGSSGAAILVVPDRQTADLFRRLKAPQIRGPFVWAADYPGGTSGRTAVMEAIARYFPMRRGFIRRMRRFDLVFAPLPTGPFRYDLISRRTANSVRFVTPAWRRGEATGDMIVPSARRIEGIRALVGPKDEPDLWAVDVRLPSSQADVVSAILTDRSR